jgi:hypothetical protein
MRERELLLRIKLGKYGVFTDRWRKTAIRVGSEIKEAKQPKSCKSIVIGASSLTFSAQLTALAACSASRFYKKKS